MAEGPQEPMVIDVRQLERIQHVHRGFLYQHLYAAECLLRAPGTGTLRIVVERDEDVEIVGPDGRLYIQVKTRGETLQPSDVIDALARFVDIRREHAAGTRQGTASFLIACNVPPSPKLTKMRGADDWPADVELIWPAGPDPKPGIPRPTASVADAVGACVAIAGTLPFAILRPDTLTWKLAGEVMMASSGSPPREDHTFESDELPALFEQLVVQMQDLPAPPLVYRSQIDEPPLQTDDRIRILCGLSGAGKTAWVAEAAVHSPAAITYIDVADIPGTALPATVAREVAARMFGRTRGVLGEILLPGASPLETLGALSVRLGQDGLHVQVVLDNVHTLPADDVRALVARAPNIRFLLVGQSGVTVAELETLLEITTETLGGWNEDTIAAAITDASCHADYPACERLSRLTGALPFYVLNAAMIAAREYDGSIAALCAEIETQTHAASVAQELILKRAFEGLSAEQAETIGVLSLSDVAIARDDAIALIETALGLSKREAMARMRSLPQSGMLELFGNDGVKIHDAVRILGCAYVAERGADFERSSQQALLDLMVDSIRRDWSVGKLGLLIRLFGSLGQADVLVQFATDELFHEMGVWPEIEPIMAAVAADASANPETRLWALDGLVFNNLREGDREAAMPRLERMKALLDTEELGASEWLAWAMKRMLALTDTGDVDGVLDMSTQVEARLPDSPEHRRIFRYNRALALFKLGQNALAASEVEPLIEEYYGVVGLTPDDVLGRNASELRPLLPKGRDLTDDLKHLADTLDLYAQSRGRDGHYTGLARIHSMKFYDLARAPQSLVRVGQDLVDDFVSRNDFVGARDVLERNLFPTIQGLGLVSWVVPVRAQYAVVLAYCGDHGAAVAEMERLRPYEAGLSPAQQGELRGQRRLVERLKRFGGPPQAQISVPPAMQAMFDARRGQATAVQKKIGRNERCPCGSTKKYKHCHGR